jgi:hypothetical protein
MCASIWGSERTAGRGPAWLRRLTGGQESPGSNPGVPTQLVVGQMYTEAFCQTLSLACKYDRKPLSERTWSDSQLISAVAASRSWRGVMRELGLCVTSAGSIKVVKRHVVRLGLDTSHFTGQRRWSDAQLRRALANAYSWPEVFTELRLLGSGDDRTRVKAHAVRLGLDLSRLEGLGADAVAQPVFKPDMKHLREAGTAIALMWFLLCGYNASIPIEPALYDLLVSMPDGIKRVQVKTTTYNKAGWAVSVGRRPYSTDNRVFEVNRGWVAG